jgi:hypothetical protein
MNESHHHHHHFLRHVLGHRKLQFLNGIFVTLLISLEKITLKIGIINRKFRGNHFVTTIHSKHESEFLKPSKQEAELNDFGIQFPPPNHFTKTKSVKVVYGNN